jgi:hypothetical protein
VNWNSSDSSHDDRKPSSRPVDSTVYVEKYVDPGFVGHELAGKLFAELLAEIADRDAFFDDAGAAQEIARRARELAAESRAADAESALAGSLDRIAERFDKSASDAGTIDVPFYRRLEPSGGLPGRSWFRNRLWAPGLEDGYGSETFPTLRSAASLGKDALEAETKSLVESIDSLRSSAAAR